MIRGYFLDRLPISKQLLHWAGGYKKANIPIADVQGLSAWMNEDPLVINHLLWAFFNINLVGEAREICCNVEDSHGLEVWRRIHRLIFSKTERRHDELYTAIHNPKAARHPGEVHGVLEEWSTNQRLFREIGGVALREDELRNMIIKIVPPTIRDQLIFKIKDFPDFTNILEYVRESARMLTVYGQSTPLKIAESAFAITEEFLDKTEHMDLEQAMMELGSDAPPAAVVMLVERRQARRDFRSRRAPGPATPKPKSFASAATETTPGRVPTSADGQPLCSNCGLEGHDKSKCPKPRIELGKRPCFRCGRPGHVSSQCKSGLPVKILEDEGPGCCSSASTASRGP